MAMNLDSLAALYLRRKTKSRGGWIAWLTVHKLIETDPEQAWEFIIAALARAKSDRELAYLGAGALEDFLQRHGLEFLGRVDEVWKREEKMRRAISCVWLS